MKISFPKRLLILLTLLSVSLWSEIYLLFAIPSFNWQATPLQISVLAACLGIPSLILGPFIGGALDHSDIRKTILFGLWFRMIIIAGLAWTNSFAVFAALALLKGLADIIIWPSFAILINRTITQEERVSFYSDRSALNQIAKVTTPLTVAVLGFLIPLQTTFLFAVLLSGLSILLMRSIQTFLPDGDPKKHSSLKSFVRNLAKKTTQIPKLPANLRMVVFLMVGVALALSLYDPHLAAFLKSEGFTTYSFSIVISATAAGAIISAILLKIRFSSISPNIIQVIGLAVFAMSLIFLASIVGYINRLGIEVLAIIFFVNGFGYEMFMIGSNVLIQNKSPSDKIGQITTTARSLQMFCIISGPSIGAMLIATSSRTTPFIIAGLLSVFLAILAASAFRSTFISRV